MPDTLDLTARQVRIPGGIPHRLTRATTKRDVGRVYSTDCGKTLYGHQGAVLTTADVECRDCNRTTVGL
jgi:hypothetical protein